MSGLPFSSGKHQMKWMSQQLDDDADERLSQCSGYTEESCDVQQEHAPDIRMRMQALFSSQKFADVKFTVKSGKKSKSVLLAHKAILAVGSRKFEEILFGPESYCVPPNTPLEIEINMNFDAFKNVVEYLYTDEICFDNDSLVLETLNAAKKFEIPSLINKCESYFDSREIFPENACSLLQLALSNKMDDLKNRCTMYVQEHTIQVLSSVDFRESELSALRVVFKLQQLNIRSEAELFDAAMNWASEKNQGKGIARSQVDPLLKSIRFLTLAPTEFNRIVQRYPNILSSKEALDIMMYITNPPQGKKVMELPTWCNKETKSRCSCSAVSALRASVADLSLTDRKYSLPIALRPYHSTQKLDSLRSVLEMRCTRGQHRITAVKLSFQGPLQELCHIGHLSLKINVSPSGFQVEELLRIQKSLDVLVTLSRYALARSGDTVRIEAQASDVLNYKFLQFDHATRSPDSPFQCNLASYPKWRRLFMISEVVYGPQIHHAADAKWGKGKRQR